MGRLDHGHKVRPEAKGYVHPPSSYARRFHYDTLTHNPSAARWLIDQVGADRVVLGTDTPFDMGAGSLQTQLDGVQVGETGWDAVAHANAERLFGLAGGNRD